MSEERTYASILAAERSHRQRERDDLDLRRAAAERENRLAAAEDEVSSRPAPDWLVEKNRAAS